MLAYHVKADPGSRYGGRRVVITNADLSWRRVVGTVPASLAARVVQRIERGEDPTTAVEWARALNAAGPRPDRRTQRT